MKSLPNRGANFKRCQEKCAALLADHEQAISPLLIIEKMLVSGVFSGAITWPQYGAAMTFIADQIDDADNRVYAILSEEVAQ